MMNNSQRKILLVMAVFVACPFVSARVSAQEDSSLVMNTAEEAFLLARKYLGVDEKKYVPDVKALSGVAVVKLKDSTTAFIGASLNAKMVWKVSFSGVELKRTHEGVESGLLGSMDFTVYLDQESGLPIKIVGRKSGLSDDVISRKASAATATKKMSSSLELYTGLPDVEPLHDFLEALNLSMGNNAAAADEVEGIYVLLSYLEKESVPVWDYHLYGIPPIHTRADVPLEQLTHFRTVVNALTGEAMFGTNTPHPD